MTDWYSPEKKSRKNRNLMWRTVYKWVKEDAFVMRTHLSREPGLSRAFLVLPCRRIDVGSSKASWLRIRTQGKGLQAIPVKHHGQNPKVTVAKNMEWRADESPQRSREADGWSSCRGKGVIPAWLLAPNPCIWMATLSKITHFENRD